MFEKYFKKLDSDVFHVNRCQITDLANFMIYLTVYKIFSFIFLT